VLHRDAVTLGELGDGLTDGVTCPDVVGLELGQLVSWSRDVLGGIDG